MSCGAVQLAVEWSVMAKVPAADQADCPEKDNERRQHGLSCRGFSERLNGLGRPIALWRRTARKSPPLLTMFLPSFQERLVIVRGSHSRLCAEARPFHRR